MTERRATEPFETRLAERARVYSDPATERSIDALATARAAMSHRRTAAWSPRWLGGGLLGRHIASARWAGALVAVVLIAVLGVAVLGRLADSRVGLQSTPEPSGGGPIPDVLRHTWARPYAVDGRDLWGSGFLSLANGLLEFGREQGASVSAAIRATGPDSLTATATVDTTGCVVGDVGTYRWSMKGKDTVLTLTAIDTDACAARESALVGEWVRSDFPPRFEGGVPLRPGRHLTQGFDPFGKPGVSGQLSYTVPERWKIKEDNADLFLLHRLPDASQSEPSTDSLIFLLAQPLMAAEFTEGAVCGEASDAPGVGPRVADLVAAMTARPGLVSTPPAAVTIGGYEGQMLDLQMSPSWTGGCLAPEGPIVGIPILQGSPGIDLNHPMRVILLDLGDDRTMAIAIANVEPSQPTAFEAQSAEVMRVIESFEFHPPVR
jgi:hypothetical protein